MVEASNRFSHDTTDFALPYFRRLHIELHRPFHRPHQAASIIGIEDEAITLGVVPIKREYRIVQTASIMRNCERTINRRLHLGKSARFEKRRHKSEIACRETKLRKTSIEIMNREAI